jgi:hypothetical protein
MTLVWTFNNQCVDDILNLYRVMSPSERCSLPSKVGLDCQTTEVCSCRQGRPNQGGMMHKASWKNSGGRNRSISASGVTS